MVDPVEVCVGFAGGLAEILFKVFWRVHKFKSILKRLQTQVKDMSSDLDKLRPSKGRSKETKELAKPLKQAKETVHRCADVPWWNYYKKNKFAQELIELEAFLPQRMQYLLTFAIWNKVSEPSPMFASLNRIFGSIRSGVKNTGDFVVDQIPSVLYRAASWTKKLVGSQPDIRRRIVLWGRKKQSRTLQFMSIATWLLLQVYQLKFITIASWVAMAIVVALFLFGNVDRLVRLEEATMSRFEISEETVDRCSDVPWWNYYKKYKFAQELIELDASLRKMMEYSLPFLILEDARRILETVVELRLMFASLNRIFGSIRSGVKNTGDFVVNQIQSVVSFAASRTKKLVESQPDIINDIVLWRRKKLSRTLLFMSIATWLLLQVYQFKFITIASWVAMVIVVALFLFGNVDRLLGQDSVFGLSEEASVSRFEISEETAVHIANSCQTLIEETIRCMVHVTIEREWFVFARTVAGLLLFSYIGSFIDLLTLLCAGAMIAATIPVIYVKHVDKIKTCGKIMRVQSGRVCELIDEKLIKTVKNKVVTEKVGKKRKQN